MRNLVYIVLVTGILIFSCGTPKKTVIESNDQQEEPVRIANDSLEYEIIIFDIGFTSYLATAKPMSFYTQTNLEAKNRVYVTEWNNRARNLIRYNSDIYENVIDYQPNIDYGMEVNYKLYQYFQFAQKKYKMRLGNFRVQ